MEERILLKARDLMLQSGLRQVTMDELAQQLGMSKKTIYQYYKDKDDLVKAVVNLELKNHEISCEACGTNAENAIHEMFLVMENMKVMTQTMNPNSMMELEKHFPSAFEIIKNHKDEFLFSLIKQNLTKGIEEGCYRNDLDIDILSKFRLETVFIPFNLRLFPLDKFNSLEVHTQLMEHFVYGLMTIKGHELMDQYKKLSKQAI
ncbi:MAG: TetR/AcrR family transcriptional regulator [Chitinophagia bacterium]|jgi:AcrR family transcriptional regulator